MNGPAPHLRRLQPYDIGHERYVALLHPETAFWSLVDKDRVEAELCGSELAERFQAQAARFAQEIHALRFELKPSGVYVNPTERCNLDCTYCYIPDTLRRHGSDMPAERLLGALQRLKEYFATVMDGGEGARKPRLIFHGAEPLMNREALFAAIDLFQDDFAFGVQTNGTLLTDAAADFLMQRNVSIGLSLDGPSAPITNATRHTWAGQGVHQHVLRAMERLQGYGSWSVITTCTTENLAHLTDMVELFHRHQVPTCMLNAVRCTLSGARGSSRRTGISPGPSSPPWNGPTSCTGRPGASWWWPILPTFCWPSWRPRRDA